MTAYKCAFCNETSTLTTINGLDVCIAHLDDAFIPVRAQMQELIDAFREPDKESDE